MAQLTVRIDDDPKDRLSTLARHEGKTMSDAGRESMKVVIETNIFVSSAFGGPPRKVVEHWFRQRITLCLSEEIFREYQRVLQEIGAVSGVRVPTRGPQGTKRTDRPSLTRPSHLQEYHADHQAEARHAGQHHRGLSGRRAG